jgi:hypothetical protein
VNGKRVPCQHGEVLQSCSPAAFRLAMDRQARRGRLEALAVPIARAGALKGGAADRAIDEASWRADRRGVRRAPKGEGEEASGPRVDARVCIRA